MVIGDNPLIHTDVGQIQPKILMKTTAFFRRSIFIKSKTLFLRSKQIIFRRYLTMFSRISNIFIVCVMLIGLVGILQATAATEEEIKAANELLMEAMNTHDVEKYVSYFTDDVINDYAPFPTPMSGREEIGAFMSDLFQASPDIQGTNQRILTSGNILVAEWTAAGTSQGEWAGIPATGNSYQLMHLSINEYEGNKIKKSTTYLDYVTLLVQLGVMPAPEPLELVPSFTLPEPEATGLPPLEAAENLVAVYNTHDMETYAKLVHLDAEVLFSPLGVPMNRDELIAAFESQFVAYPDLQQDVVRMVDMGDGWVLGDTVFRGTNDGPPYPGVQATGNSVELRVAWLVRLDADGLMTNIQVYWDELTQLTQLGLFPPPPDPEANRAIVSRVFEEVYGKGNVDFIDEICAPDYIYRRTGEPDLYGPEGFKQFASGVLATFLDIQFTVDDMIAVDDKVTSRWTYHGTHQPTGNQVTGTGVTISRLANGKLKECRTWGDRLATMQQLGVIPPSRENYTWGEPWEITGDPGDPEENEAIVLDFIEELWNQQNLDVLMGETWNPDFVAHTPVEPNNPLVGTEANRQAVIAYLTAFPDMHLVNEEVFAEGDKVVVRWKTTATHGGELMGIPPTGAQVTFTGVTIYRIADGKMVENWWAWDALGLMQQLQVAMVAEANKAVLRRVFEEVYGQGKVDVIDEICAPDYLYRVAGNPDIHGPEGFKQFAAGILVTFPDIQFTVDDMIAEGDKVTSRWTFSGTHQPTGKPVTGTGITISHLADGKLLECRTVNDVLATLQQTGVIPPDREDYTWGEPSEVTGEPGNPEENKALALRLLEEAWNQGNLDVVDETIAADFVLLDPLNPGLSVSPESTKEFVAMFRTAFPDANHTVESVIAEGDKVAVGYTFVGTHEGEYMGVPPTGKQVTYTQIDIHRFADGKIVETWVEWDALGLMQQLGVIPSMGLKDFSNVFFMPLAEGLNMISLPLEPITPYTARSFAEKVSSKVVIKLDDVRQRFVGFTTDAPDDGFPIEGGKGYIVNVPEGGMVAFTGAAWTQPPMLAAPPTQADGAWAFVVSGKLGDASTKDGYSVTIRNTRTNEVATDVVQSGYFAAAFADLTRQNVVETGDKLEVTVRDKTGEIASDILPYTVTSEAIRQAFLSLSLKHVDIPLQSMLLQNYPNPFNPETWIPYKLRKPSEVVVRIYDAQGKLVSTLDLGQRVAGFYLGRSRSAHWGGRNDAGEKVASGVYFYQIKAGDFSATRRMLIVK